MRTEWSKAHARLMRIKLRWDALLEKHPDRIDSYWAADDVGWRAILSIVDDQALFDRLVHVE